ncbi:MAG: DUF4038 domain-containing protein [Anditalea sp.]
MEQLKKLPLLKISQDRRYLVTEENAPFFWLGDTAWELFHRLNKEEALLYLENRASKGFNVIQAVIVAELDGLNTPNANGDKPLINNDPCQPNEAYFKYIDDIIEMAEKLGIYMAILPTWGDKFHKAWGLGPEIFNPLNAEKYGEFLGHHYVDCNNIIWLLGGDRTPANENHYAITRSMVKGIKKHDPRHLMTYHPNGGKIASDWYGNEEWLDLDMFQTRHQSGFKEYRFTRRALQAKPTRPVIDGEPGYENIPNLLNKFNIKRLDDADIRKSAYWNMFSGAAGHTYGCNEVWQMFEKGKPPLFGAYLPWDEAIHLPGSHQMGLLKKIFESLPWQTLHNDQKLLSPSFLGNFTTTLAMISAQKDLLLVYTPSGRPFRLKLSTLKAETVNAYWFDPVDGKIIAAGQYVTSQTVRFKPLVKKNGKDFVLIVLDSTESQKWLETSDSLRWSQGRILLPQRHYA